MLKPYPRILRYVHWFNVPLLILMMWSGVLIYWANQAYYKIPQEIVDFFRISYRLAEGMSWHFFIMWMYGINGLVYLIYFLKTKRWKVFREIYNPIQSFAYFCAIGLNILAFVSGLAIYKPVQLGMLAFVMGGYEGARFIHFFCLHALGFFILVHVIQVIRAGWKNFKPMLTGDENEN